MLRVNRKDFEMEVLPDNNPDLSWMGDYTDKPKGDFVIDRQTGLLLGESVRAVREFAVVKEGGDYKLFHGIDLKASKADIEWIDEAREDKDGYWFDVEFDDNNNPTKATVAWTHREILADGLSKMSRDETRYFESCNHRHPGNPVNWFPHVTKPKLNAAFKKADFKKHGIRPDLDKHPKEFWLDIFYFCEDYERMEDYGNGWTINGIRAKVTLEIPLGGRTIFQTIHSPGIWGIESDSDEEFIQQTCLGEVAVLENMLKELGCKVVGKKIKTSV